MRQIKNFKCSYCMLAGQKCGSVSPLLQSGKCQNGDLRVRGLSISTMGHCIVWQIYFVGSIHVSRYFLKCLRTTGHQFHPFVGPCGRMADSTANDWWNDKRWHKTRNPGRLLVPVLVCSCFPKREIHDQGTTEKMILKAVRFIISHFGKKKRTLIFTRIVIPLYLNNNVLPFVHVLGRMDTHGTFLAIFSDKGNHLKDNGYTFGWSTSDRNVLPHLSSRSQL